MQSFFVSSTFKDMQGERDALHRTVMPRLREKAAKNGENVQFVDLRWGISTSEMDSKESTSKILSVCLREVHSCKPYMIVLLGQRYGWIPPVEQIQEAGAQMDFIPEDLHISVTELEIRFGMYAAAGQLDRCIFCLRDPLEEASLTPEQRKIYLPSDDEDSRRMTALREKILNTPGAHVIRYRLESNNGELTGYEAFSQQLYAALEALLAPQWESHRLLSWQQRQRKEDAIISENHLRCFVGRNDTLQQVVDAIRYTQVVMLEGEGGCGKSALMAKLNHLYRPNYHSIVIFCGASSGCMTVQQMMRLMLWRLEVVQGKAHPEVEDDHLQEYFQEKMQSYDGPVCIFFLDAIDQLAPDQALFESRFLPPELPSSIRIVISTTGAIRVNPAALTGHTFQKIQLVPPDGEELESILHARFASEHKQISPQVAAKILENPCSKNMLGMEIMVRRLVMLGQKDFTQIARLEQTMSGAEAIDTYLLKLIGELSTNLNQLIIDYFFAISHFLEGDNSDEHSALILYIIGLLQHGISAPELEDLAHLLQTDRAFAQFPAEHPWKHFWDPVAFSQLKRYMGGLLVQRSNGNIDFSHRLLRQALLSANTATILAPVIRVWLAQLPAENLQRLENILPVSRLAEENNRRQYRDAGYDQQADLLDYFLSAPIRDAGNLDSEGDPEGKRQLEVLQRSVLQDITGADLQTVAASYCDMLKFLIQNGASADHYTTWFFGTKIVNALARLGQDEKVCSLRLISCILSSLHKQKEAFEAGEERFRENWTTQRKRRFLSYHCSALQKIADLYMDFRLGNVKLYCYDGLTADVIFQKGCALADECIREDPSYGLFYLRKAALYAAFAQKTSEGANFGIIKGKQRRYTEKAFQCIQQAFRLKVTAFFREYALYIMAICVESIYTNGSGRLFGAKETLDFGIEMCQKTWALIHENGGLEDVPIDCIARFKLAWSLCLDGQSELPFCRDEKPWRQQSLELCCEYYLQVRNQPELSLDPLSRKYLGLLGVQACLMLLYGHSSQVMADAGYNRIQALCYISNLEAGYFRAEARKDFKSRWHWAIMLCAEACDSNLKPKAGVECTERAISLLEALHKAADDKGYAVDINASRIEALSKFAQHLNKQYVELAENSKA